MNMAGKWEGFSEEDIGRYLQNNEEASDRVVPKRKATNLQRQGKKNVIRERMLKHITTSDEPIPEGAKLSKEAQESLPLMVSTDQKVDDEVAPTAENEISLKISDDVVPSVQNPVCLKVIEGNGYEVVEKDPSAVSTGTLEVFQARQKILEEQNKRRKELLSKVLSDRKKQTREEAKRLQNIQEELHKLDLLLSNDVGILRNQIEDASLEFVEAQKRYDKAEKEFLDAKHSLFTKLEKKELLTRHLCTIIEQSEMRKAQKLSELMEKLKINETSVEEKSDLNAVIISPYFKSALNDSKSSKASGTVNQGCDADTDADADASADADVKPSQN